MGSIIRITCLLCLVGSVAAAQMQKDYLIHKRGMLHQTVFNTGSSAGSTSRRTPTQNRHSFVRVAR